MRRMCLVVILCFVVFSALVPSARAEEAKQAKQGQRPYIGFVYPAGGQQGTTFRIRLGGQDINKISDIIVSGEGVSARLTECRRWLNNQEVKVLLEQLQQLDPSYGANTNGTMTEAEAIKHYQRLMRKHFAELGATFSADQTGPSANDSFATRLEKRIVDHVPRPACKAIANLVFVEVTVAAGAPPGAREIRLVTPAGVSNPLAFYVGQVREFSRKPLPTSPVQVLGKEEQALNRRPHEQGENRVSLPCTINGQIASGEENRYRFAARKGQRLVITTLGRQLIPFIADAVPGWLQPVVTLYDGSGKQVAYDDHYKFKPDPVLFYEVPKDGDYVLAVHDALYRGREDFVYRITVGELPFVTSIFPLGARVGEPVTIKMKGWHVGDDRLEPPAPGSAPGIYQLAAGSNGLISNRVPFRLDTLPECLEVENENKATSAINTKHKGDLSVAARTVKRRNQPSGKHYAIKNKSPLECGAGAQKVTLPVIINGRIDRPGDTDMFEFTGKANDTVVAEVYARRLDSPLDSVLKLTDAKGKLIAFNDDHEDPCSGLNTQDADSYIMTRLPADGNYFIQITDTSRNGGEDYAYRLRLSAPQPDFSLRATPSSAGLRSRGYTTFTVYAVRKDGFSAPITLSVKDADSGFSSTPVRLMETEDKTSLLVHTNVIATKEPVDLIIEGRATIGSKEIIHSAVPAEDRMQAFLWRHLVPAEDLKVVVFDPRTLLDRQSAFLLRQRRKADLETASANNESAASGKSAEKPGASAAGTNEMPDASGASPAQKGKPDKKQGLKWLIGLKRLHDEGLLTDDYYQERVRQLQVAAP